MIGFGGGRGGHEELSARRAARNAARGGAWGSAWAVARSAVVAGAVAGTIAACGDATGVWTSYYPEETLDQVDAVLTPIEENGDLLLGLELVVATLEYHGSAVLGDALAVSPDRAGAATASTDGPTAIREVLRGARSAARAGGGASGARVEGGMSSSRKALPAGAGAEFSIPWSVQGETLEWDPVEGYYISGRSGAPADGVRFFLYRMNGETGYPTRPLSRIGYLDVIDDDRGAAEAVVVEAVRTDGPDRRLARYRVEMELFGDSDEGGLALATRGEFDGVGLDLLQRLEWSWSRDEDELTLDYRYDRGATTVVLEGVADSRFDATDWDTFAMDVALRGRGADTDVDARIDQDGALRGGIWSDGRRIVRIRGHDGSPRFEREDGGRLSGPEIGVLEQVWTGITDLIWLTDWVATPADLLTLGG